MADDDPLGATTTIAAPQSKGSRAPKVSSDDPLSATVQLGPHPAAPMRNVTPTPSAQSPIDKVKAYMEWANKPANVQMGQPPPGSNAVLDLLNRTSSAGQAARLRGPGAGLQALIHGEPSAQYLADQAEIARRNTELSVPLLGTFGAITGIGPRAVIRPAMTPQQYAAQPGWMRNTLQTEAGATYDPLTYAGGSGLARMGVEKATEETLPAIMRAHAKLAAQPGVVGAAAERAGKLAAGVHNFMTGGELTEAGVNPAAHMLRQAALTKGRAGVQEFQKLYSLRGAGETIGAGFATTLTRGFNTVMRNLSQDDKSAVFKALHNGTVDELPDRLQRSAQVVQQYDRAIPYVLGTGALRSTMRKAGYTLPMDLQQFDPRGFTYGAVKSNQYLENHIPLIHELDPEIAQKVAERAQLGLRGRWDLDWKNPQFSPRMIQEDEENLAKGLDPADTEERFVSSFRRAGRQLSGAHVGNILKQTYAPGRVVKVARGLSKMPNRADAIRLANAFERFAQTDPQYAMNPAIQRMAAQAGQAVPEFLQRNLGQTVRDIITKSSRELKSTGRVTRVMADVPKDVRNFFARPGQKLSPNEWKRAMQQSEQEVSKLVNVTRGAQFTLPIGHMARIASLGLVHDPVAVAQAVGKFARMGAGFGSPAAIEREIGPAARYGATGVPNVEAATPLQQAFRKAGEYAAQADTGVRGRVGAALGRGAANWYGGVGKMLWHWDDAMKAALWKRYLGRYKDPYVAAYHVQQDMVNYGASSPFLRGAARYVSSFPVWRQRLPLAMARAAAKNPHLVTNLARIAPWLFGGAVMVGGQPYNFYGSAPAEGLQPFEGKSAAMKYARSSMRPFVKMAGTAALGQIPGIRPEQARWPTAGLTERQELAQSAPILNQILPYLGHGAYHETPGQAALFQLLQLGAQLPGKTKTARRREAPRRRRTVAAAPQSIW